MTAAALAAILTAIGAVIISAITMIQARAVQKDKELAHQLLQAEIDRVQRERDEADQLLQTEMNRVRRYLDKLNKERGDSGDV